jgi:hypothetical protein
LSGRVRLDGNGGSEVEITHLIRTLVSLDPDDKSWLDRTAMERGVPMTELVREAIRRLRAASESPAESHDVLLDRTRGMWRGEDGATWQDRLRDEW